MHRLQDETLASIGRRSTTYGPAARHILRERVDGVAETTATLRDLTAEIEADNATVRPLLAGSGHQQRADEDAALSELRRLYG